MVTSFRVVLAGVVVAVVATACLPPQQLDIDFTVRRTGTYRTSQDLNGNTVTYLRMSGILACSGGTTSNVEPLDLFLSATPPGAPNPSFSVAHDACQNQPKVWKRTWRVLLPPGTDISAGPVAISVNACTNPGQIIDEDCTVDSENVTFTFAP